MRRNVVLSVFAALLAGGPLYAQTGQVTGSVTSSEGARALSGAAVTVAGTTLRAVTGPDGRYTLSGVPAGTQRLTATVLGHAPATQSVAVAAGQTATLNFALSPSAVALQGVVAIGYGERRVRDVTGSIQAVGQEQFNTGRVVNPEHLIQGKVAGVQVIDNGQPGGGSAIRIRGGTSVTSSNEPLFVVDGVPLQPGGGLSSDISRSPLNFINPQDIERVTVLKDAASTAIYGSRGANGVIIIETRNGNAREPAFSYTNSVSTSNVIRGPDMLSADQFRAVVAAHAPGRVQFLGNTSTDWRGAVERNGFGQEHALAIGGVGGPAMSYRLSLNYLEQSGVLRGSETDRLSAALNYSNRLFSDRLNVRGTIRAARTRDDFTPGGVLGAATVYDPTVPITVANGFFEQPFQQAPDNPVAQLAGVVDNGSTFRSIGNIEARYRMPFLEQLTGTLRTGYDYARSERRSFTPTTLHSQITSTTPGSAYRSNPSEQTGVIDAFLNYNNRIRASEIDVTGGYSYEETRGQYTSFTAKGLTSNLLGDNGVPTATQVVPFDSIRDSRLASFFGRVNYTLKDRYLLTLSLRRDGSSRFGPRNQWGNFPAAALGWRVNEEPWFPEGTPLSELKLRGSWGVNGNQSFADYQWTSTYRYGDALSQVQFGDTFVTTIRPSAVDPNIKWEETTSTNVGFDYGLWDDRITGSVDYYVKDTKDLIFRTAVPAGTNLSNFVTTNIGSMRNKGLELSVNAQVLRGSPRGLSYNASFNASTNKNRLLTINPNASTAQQQLVGGIAGGVGGNIEVLQPGVPVFAFYVLEHRRDASGNPVPDVDAQGHQRPDTDLYVDRNGDGAITQDDRRPFHSPTPQWILAHTSNFGYRSFDLGFTMRAQLGSYVYNNVASANGYFNQLNNAAGLLNLHASVLKYNFTAPQYYSDVYVEDASFLRMDNITLGYTLPRLRGVRQARVYGTVQNAFTLTGYSGVDPEAGLNGIDNSIYPRSRTFSAGVSLAF
ncbi:SusC/RagA family TonB-linked outer membrane protein [Longimicrobium sp.]|uniref:SusC/RagA family TonB-linked outer membrane protein n=1 Tax=Longimicrobium sp. TaxID=2029185 RepID=UPI002C1EA0D3|nr:SusC/RagA family TonB-linked outer membrane protein [Longimicrobium sp.]HSU14573.1 SusC/RagA family TonB-linked outer membrane protein [Longimicrobium sp.]